MLFKVILGAIIGGALMFGGGYVDHMLLDWGGRQLKSPKDGAAFLNAIKEQCPDGGVYIHPKPPKDLASKPQEEQKKYWEQYGEEFKNRNYGFAVAVKQGQEFSFEKTLMYEGISNVIACLFAAIVVAMTRPSIGFIGRWFVVMMIAMFSCAALSASYHIWYHFPLEFIQDEIMCAALEAAMAGVAIAAIVVPRESVTPGF